MNSAVLYTATRGNKMNINLIGQGYQIDILINRCEVKVFIDIDTSVSIITYKTYLQIIRKGN